MKYSARFDYYKLLGISATSTADEISRARRARMREVHPDLNHERTPRAAQRINGATEVLLNPTLRAKYDSSRSAHLVAKERRRAAAKERRRAAAEERRHAADEDRRRADAQEATKQTSAPPFSASSYQPGSVMTSSLSIAGGLFEEDRPLLGILAVIGGVLAEVALLDLLAQTQRCRVNI